MESNKGDSPPSSSPSSTSILLALGSLVLALVFIVPCTNLGFLLFALASFLLLSYLFAVEPPVVTRCKPSSVTIGEPRTVVESHGVKVFVGSWNVGDSTPSTEEQSLASWIPKDKYDVYVIGAQECCYKPRPPHTSCEADWIALLQRHIGEQYSILASTSTREAIRLVVFIRSELDASVSNIISASTLTQLPFFWRKGANGIAFDLFDTSFCFVNAHLSAHQNQVRARENDVHCILRKLFNSPFASSLSSLAPSSSDLMNRFDNLVFFGDLNYRIDSSKETTEALVKSEKWVDLLAHDQLNKEHGAQRLFGYMQIVNPHYGPTYKFITSKKEGVGSNSAKRTYATGRRPAWCDRILFSNGLKLAESGSPENIRTSDHSPVFATFDATVVKFANDEGEEQLATCSIRFDSIEAVLNNHTKQPVTQLWMSSNIFNSEIRSPICQGGSIWNEGDLKTVTISHLSVAVLRKQRIAVSVVDYANYYTFEQGNGVIGLEDVATAEAASFSVPLFLNSRKVGELKGKITLLV